MSVYHYTAVFEPAYDGGFIVTVPALAGLVTEGDTLEEARAMIKDAVQRLLESLMQHGEEIPVESSSATIESVEVEARKSNLSCLTAAVRRHSPLSIFTSSAARCAWEFAQFYLYSYGVAALVKRGGNTHHAGALTPSRLAIPDGGCPSNGSAMRNRRQGAS